jgi:RND family efflux transporter MFP subunit
MVMARLTGAGCIVTALFLLAVLAGCGESNTYVPPPPPKVTVAQPVKKTITRHLQATGNAAAVNTANLVARVPGFLETIDYKDGDFVKKGTVLFTIERETYELKYKQSQAAEQSSRAIQIQMQAEYERQADLVPRGAASKSALDNALANRDNAQANYLQAQINTKLAAINFDYSSVTAPFDGIVTARTVSVGEYVGATSTPTVLATIVQLDPIYVNFSVDEQEVIRIRAGMRERGITPEELRTRVPVSVGLQSEEGFPHAGTLDYVAPSIDSSTGTLAVRAILQNPQRALLPGYFVRVQVPLTQQADALLVPNTALGADQSGRYLLVVGKDNIVEQRKVDVGPVDGDLRVIEKGISPTDQVIVSGLLRAIPGQKVDPQTAAAAGASGARAN